MSLPFTVAVALLRGGVTLTDFSEDTRSNIAVQALMNKVQVVLDDAADAAYPKSGRPADVTVVMNEGTRYQHRVEQPYGEPSNPLSDSDLEGKARALVEPVIAPTAPRT